MRSRGIFLSIILVIFVGCSSKKEQDLLKSYTKNMEYHKNLQQTETATLKSGEEKVAMMTATYLFRSTLDKNDTRDEKFIIAVQFEEDNASMNFKKKYIKNIAKSNISLDKNSSRRDRNKELYAYTLTLNNKKAIKVKRIAFGDRRLKDLSFVTAWSEYYEVTFKNTKSSRFTLMFGHPIYGNTFLRFSKVARFVYTKKGF